MITFARSGLAALILLFLGAGAHAEYRLQPSDVLELSVAGIPDLQQRSSIDLDGSVVFPLAGQMHVAGKTLAEVQREFERHLVSKSIDTETSEGVRTYFIQPDQVTITIAEYRPIYISGDVAKPGEQAFRPGLTVRQAIAVAGGYDLLSFRTENPFIEAAALRAEYDSLWIEFADAQSELARLVAELAGATELDRQHLADLPVSAPLLDEIARNESEQLTLRMTDLEKERQHLRRLIEQNQQRLALLSEEQSQVREDREADKADFERIRGLLERGMLTANRASEARQGLLNSSLRFLSTTAELRAVSDGLEGFKRDLEKVDTDRRLELLASLKKVRVTVAKTLSDLSAVSEKLLHVGNARSTVAQNLTGTPKITIFDGNDPDKPGRIAGESDLLSPGDLVEVTLEPPWAAGAVDDATTGAVEPSGGNR